MTEIEKLEMRIHNLEVGLMALAKASLALMPDGFSIPVDDVMSALDDAAIGLGVNELNAIRRDI